MPERFKRGEPVTLRDVDAGRIKAAVSFITVEHSVKRFVGWLPAGGQFALPVDSAGNLVKDVLASHRLAELTWQMPGSPGQLIVAEAGAAYSVILRYFGDTWALPEWYVNLQAPLWRTELGFDCTDNMLDLVVSRDGSSWRWKDEDEFERAVRGGFVTHEQAEGIRSTGREALELARAGTAPFDDEFIAFRPDPDWEPPMLANRWLEHPLQPD